MSATVLVGETSVGGALHRLVVDSSPDLQSVADVDGIYRFVSPAGLEPFGWTPADLHDRPVVSFAHPDDRVLVEDVHAAAWRSVETVTASSRLRCADGSYRWVESRSRSVDTDGVRLVVSSARDLADFSGDRADGRGSDLVDVFDGDRMHAAGRLGTERMVRRAITEDRLRVSYQPIIDLATGDTVAVEALVRVWDDDTDELILAEAFIEVAEEAGLARAIDDWMLSQVIEQAAVWCTLFAGTAFADVAVNVTARQLAVAGFAHSVIADLAAHNVPAGVLRVEVTERVLMEASTSVLTGLKVLRNGGVKVGFDDFGTGYSSLSYLRMFPVDFVKIDRSFVRGLVEGTTERAVVASVIDLSHALGLAVIAEGVETRAQADVLSELGCDRAQGFHYARAGTREAVEARVLGTSATGPVSCRVSPLSAAHV